MDSPAFNNPESKTCPRCGVDQPRANYNKGRSECRSCSKEIHRAYRESAKGKAAEAKYLLTGKTKVAVRRWCQSEHGRTRMRMSGIARLYGMTPEAYDALLEHQGGRCCVCLKPPNARRLCVDHDHATGQVRGLLCIACNLLVAQIERNDETAARARAYLKNPPAARALSA